MNRSSTSKYSNKTSRARARGAAEALEAARAEARAEASLARAGRTQALDKRDQKQSDRARIQELLARALDGWMHMPEAKLASLMLAVAMILSKNAGLSLRLERIDEPRVADVEEAYRLMLKGRASYRDVMLRAMAVAIDCGAELEHCLELLPELSGD